MTTREARTGGRILVDQLVAQGVDHVFCVPGESYLAVLDALHDSPIALTVCRQEAGAGMMADAHARLTGRPGIAMVTRGPGATNAAHAIHIAQHDSVPLILFVGQIERGMRGRGAFQEMDYAAFFGSTAKWAVEIDDAARIPELVSRAFHVALQGRPGPVVIALPEDMLVDVAEVADASRVEPVQAWPGLTQMAELQKLLWAAQRPFLVLGGSGWTTTARASVGRFAERFDLPVATSFRRASLFDADHSSYAGEIGIGPNPRLKARIEAADLLILLGARMAEIPSQSYTLLRIPSPGQTLVQIHPGSEELGRVYHPALGIQASPATFAATLESVQPPQTLRWAAETRSARKDYLDWTGQPAADVPGPVDMAEIVMWLRDRLPANAIVTNGAGNYAIWVGRYMRLTGARSQLAPTSGSMGYGLPAAVAAKRVAPERCVVCFAGDGCFLMNGQEFATAVQYRLNIIVVVVDNSMYGTIRMHQERTYPGRVSGTDLHNPDFAAYARAFGGHGETVERTQDFAPAFERALQAGLPAIIHVKVDPEALTPAKSLSQLRQEGLAAHKG
ncbi:thiamine pyrophosphate-binding protein [Lichenifustis flavocetrariae]|uniref:Thiamine pyrophosphate-binding protein n=1 Tax=Lichenifustis flavocetrariae TaxID=2949735 RepID=A0AA41YZD5_9HYPH|nr:thiamine pyrophosphate-binding protein [Lichenifustis flavocetrariae]MCW6509898.1 thiamine pyrophosphate-binding protein [Lichenifustis flavocetrariae]